MLARRLRAKAAQVWLCGSIEIIVTTPAITWDSEVVFELNTNRHIGNIDTTGLRS